MAFKFLFDKYPKIFRIFIIFSLLFLSSCQSKEVVVNVEIADQPGERTLGLMNRDILEKDHGMLFIFEGEDYWSFWMKNTLIPLDLIFISDQYTIVDIKENFQPCKVDNCDSYTSKKKAKYVLEVNSGFVKENNVKIGDKIKHEGIYVYFWKG